MNRSETTQNDTTKPRERLLYKELSYKLQGACFAVRKNLGRFFREPVYQKALAQELRKCSVPFAREKRITVIYNGRQVGTYVPDFVIDEKIVVEIKAVPLLTQDHKRQFWAYLRATNYRLGYLVNFGSANRIELIRRIYDAARK